MDSNFKAKLKESLLLSAGLFILGKKKAEELVKSLEDSGLTKEEAEKTAQEVLASARDYKKHFLQKLTTEIEEKSMFATKDDIAKIEQTLEEISHKLDEEKE